MKVLLSIGYDHYLMPSTAAAERVLSGLSKAVELERSYQDDAMVYYPRCEKGDPCRVRLELVPDDRVLKRKPLLALPQPSTTSDS